MNALVNRKHQVVLIAPGSKGAHESNLLRSLGADYIPLKAHILGTSATKSIVYPLRLIDTIRDADRRFKFDVIHFVNYSTNLLVYPLIRRFSRAPVVSDLHALASLRQTEPTVNEPLVSWAIGLVFEEMALRFSDVIITPTDELRNVLARRFAHPRNIFAVPNCVWTGEPSLDRLVKTAAREDRSAESTIFFHANFLPSSSSVKRSLRELERLKEVLRQITARGQNVKLWLAGPGVSALSHDRVEPVVYLGYVEDPLAYLLRSDLVILPVRDRTLGIHSRLVEAMIAGKPVVATREACCGLFPHIRRSGITICESLKEMAESACSILEDSRRMKMLGERNRRVAEELFSSSRVGMQLEHAYSVALSG